MLGIEAESVHCMHSKYLTFCIIISVPYIYSELNVFYEFERRGIYFYYSYEYLIQRLNDFIKVTELILDLF